MARITVEDCLVNQSNRFSLVRLAARRAKQLLSGSTPVADTKGNRAIVSALREIAGGKVRFRGEETSPADEFSDPLLREINLAALEAASASSATAAASAPAAAPTPASPSPAGTPAAAPVEAAVEAEAEAPAAEEAPAAAGEEPAAAEEAPVAAAEEEPAATEEAPAAAEEEPAAAEEAEKVE